MPYDVPYAPPVTSGITAGGAGGLGAAGLGAALGFGPLGWASLLAFAPGLLARLFGGDSNAILRRRVAELTSPNNLSKLTNQFYQTGLGSPAYSSALGMIAAGANQSANDVARNLAMSGIGSSGTGAVLSGLTPSLVGSQRAGLQGALYNASQQQAQSTIEQQLKALYAGMGPSYAAQLSGAGLAAFGPFLQAWLKARYPGMDFGGVRA